MLCQGVTLGRNVFLLFHLCGVLFMEIVVLVKVFTISCVHISDIYNKVIVSFVRWAIEAREPQD